MGLNAKWQATMDAALHNPASSKYDDLIRKTLTHYQIRFGKTPGFSPPDWRIFKAMVLVESGGPTNSAWTTRPIQIGNPGDPAYGVLKAGTQGANLIVSADLKASLMTGNISTPDLNIRTGIAYVFTMAAEFHPQQIIDDPALRHVTVKSGDSLYRIALRNHTTIANLIQENPKHTGGLHPSDTLTYQTAHMAMAIKGWRIIDPDFLAIYYNSGDPNYAAKLRYVLGKLGK